MKASLAGAEVAADNKSIVVAMKVRIHFPPLTLHYPRDSFTNS
jgi:hypothetical protein